VRGRILLLVTFLVPATAGLATAALHRPVPPDGFYLVLRQGEQVRALRPLAGNECLVVCTECSPDCPPLRRDRLRDVKSYLVIHTRPDAHLSLAEPATLGSFGRGVYNLPDPNFAFDWIPLHLPLDWRSVTEISRLTGKHLSEKGIIFLSGRVVALSQVQVMGGNVLEASCCGPGALGALDQITLRPFRTLRAVW
jgi:hypothetical protein